MSEVAFLVCATLAGLLFGSLATVLCYRIPRDIPLGLWREPRSKCPQCRQVIAWYSNIPLLSYLLQRGKCRACGASISARYPLIEISTAALFFSTTLVYLRSANPPLESTLYWLEYAKVMYFAYALLVTTFIDIEFRIIPDRFSLGNWGIALAAALLWGEPPLLQAILGGAVGAGVFYLLAWYYEKRRGIEGLGLGDVKMIGWLGTWLGVEALVFIVLTASLSGVFAGLIAMRRSRQGFQTAIPFGPFLALGGYLAWALRTLGMW